MKARQGLLQPGMNVDVICSDEGTYNSVISSANVLRVNVDGSVFVEYHKVLPLMGSRGWHRRPLLSGFRHAVV
jgi:hypothetical protein